MPIFNKKMLSKNHSPQSLLAIRADFTQSSGAGHVMRCLALAQAWRLKGEKCVFVISSESHKACLSVINDFGFEAEVLAAPIGSAEDEDETVALLNRRGASFVVLDGYLFKSSFQKKLKSCHFLTLVLDDNQSCDYYYADLILNPNIHAHEAMYRNRAMYTQLLLQPPFFLIREEFQNSPKSSGMGAYPALKILISMGGSDSQNVTAKVLKSLAHQSLEQCSIKVIVGSSNPHLKLLELEAQRFQNTSVELVINPPKVSDIMRWADVSISAGGVMSYELAFLGVPQINLSIAENQRESAKALAATGASSYLGDAQNLSEKDLCDAFLAIVQSSEKLSKMANQAKLLVDGKGAGRVVESMINFFEQGGSQ